MSDSSSCVIFGQKRHKKIFFGGNHCSFHVLYINSDSNLKWKISLQWHFNPIAFNLEPFQQVNKTFNGTRYHGTQRNLFLQCRSQSWPFNNYFSSVFNDNTYLPFGLPSSPFTENSITSIVLSQEDVLPALQNLNPTKPQDPDNSPPMIMKECANELAPSLCMLLKEFIALGSYP